METAPVDSSAFDLPLLKRALDLLKPLWKKPTKLFNVRPGGGERYLQEKILTKAHPCLA